MLNRMKKTRFIFLAAVIAAGIFASCSNPAGDDNQPVETPQTAAPSADGNTYVKFDNTQGVCTVIVYNDYQRRNTDIITTVRAGASSTQILWTGSASWPFYLSWQFAVPGAEENTVIYTPSTVEKNQVLARIDSGKITSIRIPKLEDTLPALNELLSGDSYLIIQNNASYSFMLHRGSSQITPENLGGAVVNAGEKALYKVEGGAASSAYTLLVGASSVGFPASPAQFAAGHVYRFVYSGAEITAQSETRFDITTVERVQSGAGALPAPPGGLMVTAVTQNAVSLSWNTMAGVSGYRIYRSSAVDGPFVQSGALSATAALPYTDTGLAANTAYYYNVSAVSAAGESALSGVVGALTSGPPAAPAAPVVSAGDGSLTLSWAAAAKANAYEIWISETNDSAGAVKRGADVTGTSAVINGLTNETTYYVWLKAKNAEGTSGFSPAASGKPSVSAVPPAATGTPVITLGSGRCTVTWNAVAGASAYEVYLGTSPAFSSVSKYGADVAGSLFKTITGLTNGAAYYLWVKAKNSVGSSGESPAAMAIPLADAAAPTLTAADGRLTASWAAVDGAAQYDVFYSATTTPPESPAQTVSGTTATITGLTNGVTCHVWVRGRNATGAGVMSAAASGIPVPAPFTVTFNSSGGSAVAAQSVVSGGKATEPNPVPTKTGYSLEGWYKETALTNRWNFATDTVTADITLYAKWVAPGTLMTRTVNGKTINFRYVPSGSFQRDSTAANVSVITKGYWLGETEVTQELFQAVMETNPSYFNGSSGKEAADGETQAKRPVEGINWYAAIAFCNKLSVADGKDPVYSVSGITDWTNLAYSSIPISGNSTWNRVTQDLSKNGYRLPTEMEWMWAAMGADKTTQPNTSGYNKAFAGSNRSNSIENYVWYDDPSGKTHEVGKKTANELNLFDMSGNVFEWVWDWYDSYSNGELTDPAGPASGTYRVIRGGSWHFDASYCAVAYQGYGSPNARSSSIGFRVLAAP
jgi:uncharacterized repeat protein (TIGR02543 family)